MDAYREPLEVNRWRKAVPHCCGTCSMFRRDDYYCSVQGCIVPKYYAESVHNDTKVCPDWASNADEIPF